VRLLVDTHIVLWRMLADRRLPKLAIELMDAADTKVVVSVVSVWEVTVKHALVRRGVQGLPLSGSDFLNELSAVGTQPLPILAEHVVALDKLPLFHSDPFDRLLVAQAMSESLVLLTHDAQLADYGELVRVV
jgi:PIN domain nuclease of toxin-antitoxin system